MHTMMKRTLVLVLSCLLLSKAGIAQQPLSDVPGVRACLEEYMSGDGNRMEKAFHPSATMKYIDVTTGEFKDVPIADFIARTKAATTKPERKIDIVSIDVEGTAASGKIKIETRDAVMYDYMNLLKVNGEWKIVSKIFSRQHI